MAAGNPRPDKENRPCYSDAGRKRRRMGCRGSDRMQRRLEVLRSRRAGLAVLFATWVMAGTPATAGANAISLTASPHCTVEVVRHSGTGCPAQSIKHAQDRRDGPDICPLVAFLNDGERQSAFRIMIPGLEIQAHGAASGVDAITILREEKSVALYTEFYGRSYPREYSVKAEIRTDGTLAATFRNHFTTLDPEQVFAVTGAIAPGQSATLSYSAMAKVGHPDDDTAFQEVSMAIPVTVLAGSAACDAPE